MEVLTNILKGLMTRYKDRIPDVNKITTAMIEMGMIASEATIENDHIAFRTLGVPNLGIESLEKIFLFHGYKKEDSYNFEEKKLNAYWYSPPTPSFPRVFISELRVDELPIEQQKIIIKYTQKISKDPVDSLNLNSVSEVDSFLHSPLWELPTIADFNKLAEVSEYASWVIYNRYYLNHYTISVHNLPSPYNQLIEFNLFLKDIGIELNQSGGEIKKSPDGLLLQSASISKLLTAVFKNNETKQIAGSYVEFAERKILDQYKNLPLTAINRTHRKEGFEASNADKIFESTYTSQTNSLKK
ncbi:DUF1338 domain-containing protein [Flavobacteriaceae bacterium]|nr:DUF1338 domain-containing protein [Flavobacteriaceae bacterium]